jgi:NTE family protein
MRPADDSLSKKALQYVGGMPVERIDTGSDHDFGLPEPGIGLCLSGGGFRAMLFHLGAIWRLNELGYLPKLARISSVSGGSITAGVLGMKWRQLHFGPDGCADNFVQEVVQPIRSLASRSVDVWAILSGLLIPVRISQQVITAYEKYVFHGAKLTDLPERPCFVFNATNVQSGVLWRFTKSYMADYRVGRINKSDLPLAVAVAASSAFPPVLSPVKLEFKPEDYVPSSGKDLQQPPYTTKVYLTDGGVYDNLGLETIWKKYDTVLISDGGGRTAAEPDPALNWLGHIYRVLGLIDNEVRSLRKRQAIDSFALYDELHFVDGDPNQDSLRGVARKGTYWGIWTDITNYGLVNTLSCPHEQTLRLAKTSTRLNSLLADAQERIINWGYAACDAAMRRHVDRFLAAPTGFPYPAVCVG